MAEVRNVKISLKIKGCSLDIARKSLTIKNIQYKTAPNFISFSLNNYTYIYFKEPMNNKFVNHINVTKIPSVDKINDAINNLKSICPVQIVSQSVDNIIATGNLASPINIKEVINQKCFVHTKYNPEQFPGIFVKFNSGTIILFHSGKIVLVGFKRLDLLNTVLDQVCACMKTI